MLNLSSVNAGAKGAMHLADALRGSSLQRTVEHLVFGHNDIGPEGCTAIVEAVGPPLQENGDPAWHSNKIMSDGAVALSKNYRPHASLAVLDIGNNGIGDRGCEMLRNMLLRTMRFDDSTSTIFYSAGKPCADFD